MLCCVLMCMSAGQWVIMCVRLWVPVVLCVCVCVCRLHLWNHLFSFGKLPEQCDVRNEACGGVLGLHVVVRVLSGVFRVKEYLTLCWNQVFVCLSL